MDSWVFHPDQSMNLLSSYDLDIGIVNKDLQLDASITVPNNAKTNTGVDVFFVHPTLLENAPATPVLSLRDKLVTAALGVSYQRLRNIFMAFARAD